MEYIMTMAGELDHASGSLVSGGVFTITSLASISTKIDNQGVYTSPLAFTFAGGTYNNQWPIPVAGGVITSSANFVKAGNIAVMLEGDSGDMSGSYIDSSSGTSVSVPFTSSVEVSSAGQSNTKAD